MDRRRESSVQRRATSAVKSEQAAGCADEMMQRLLEDGQTGRQEQKRVPPKRVEGY